MGNKNPPPPKKKNCRICCHNFKKENHQVEQKYIRIVVFVAEWVTSGAVFGLAEFVCLSFGLQLSSPWRVFSHCIGVFDYLSHSINGWNCLALMLGHYNFVSGHAHNKWHPQYCQKKSSCILSRHVFTAIMALLFLNSFKKQIMQNHLSTFHLLRVSKGNR